MEGHERPYDLLPKLGTERQRISMTGFTQSKTVVSWRLNLKLKVSMFHDLFNVVWMFGTKLVHVCEGTVRYPVGWVQDCDLVGCYCLYE